MDNVKRREMIPKIIHYCWFGGNPLPELAIKCIESWKKYLPDYEIKEWNESNFNVYYNQYTSEAYKAKKYAYVSDYVRFWVLYNEGGIYFDTDVEIIRPLDDIIAKGPFMGCEKDGNGIESYPEINPGIILASTAQHPLMNEIVNFYNCLSFVKENPCANNGIYKTVVAYTTEVLIKHGLTKVTGIQQVEEFTIYPKEYFNPLEHINQLKVTDNTRTIHHYAGTWLPKKYRLLRYFVRMIGPKLYYLILKLKNSTK